MPIRTYRRGRKTFRKRTNFRRTVRRYRPIKKRVAANSEVLTYMMPRQMPFPPRYRTKMHMKFMALITTGGLDVTGNGRAYIGLNYVTTPLNNTTWTLTGPWSVIGTVGAATMQPLGLSQLLPTSGQFYRNYRVYSSKVAIQASPASPNDYFELSVTPSRQTSVPADTSVAMAQPYTKSKAFFTGKPAANTADILANYMTVHRLAGVTSRAIQDDLSGNFTGTYFPVLPVTQYYWVINISKIANSDSVADIMFEFHVTYWLEFFNASSGGFPIT